MHFGFIKEVAMKREKLVVGLDVGSTKVCAMVAEVAPVDRSDGKTMLRSGRFSPAGMPLFGGLNESNINIIGVGTAVSRGIKKGEVSSIENTVVAIKEAIQQAGTMAGVEIRAVYLGITGKHISCISSNGVIAVKEKEIGEKDVDSVIEAAKAVAIPFDRQILHVMPLGFVVNGQNGITDPIGMAGVRLETNVQIITGNCNSVQNLVRCCQRADLEIIDIVYQPLASSNAVVTEDEKNLGVAVIDIGGGTTDIAVFQDGTLAHSAVLTIGGNNFTNDLAIGLRIPTMEAENIKRIHGCSMISMIKEDDFLNVGYADSRLVKKIPRRYLVEILQPRAEELFTMVRDEIIRRGYYKNLNSGIVLTGGGVLMEGMDVMAENILELPVRIGTPFDVRCVKDQIFSPEYSAATGLVIWGADDAVKEEQEHGGGFMTGFMSRMKGWLASIF